MKYRAKEHDLNAGEQKLKSQQGAQEIITAFAGYQEIGEDSARAEKQGLPRSGLANMAAFE